MLETVRNEARGGWEPHLLPAGQSSAVRRKMLMEVERQSKSCWNSVILCTSAPLIACSLMTVVVMSANSRVRPGFRFQFTEEVCDGRF
jgi:hypothetical protein